MARSAKILTFASVEQMAANLIHAALPAQGLRQLGADTAPACASAAVAFSFQIAVRAVTHFGPALKETGGGGDTAGTDAVTSVGVFCRLWCGRYAPIPALSSAQLWGKHTEPTVCLRDAEPSAAATSSHRAVRITSPTEMITCHFSPLFDVLSCAFH